ncbi:MAG: TatD family deoxyribonuclease, partial [Treponema sp.]|nr:TatD family deoxyribonuclease [Treponema sp.]
MFSDTHFHLHYISEKTGIQGASAILSGMASLGAEFGLDIGTKADDLLCRRDAVVQALALLPDEQKDAVEKFLCFSAG